MRRPHRGLAADRRRAQGPASRYDPNAVTVRCATGEPIGYLPKLKAAEVIPYLDAGHRIQGEIVGFTGGTPDKPTLGVSIQVTDSTKP